MDSRLFRFGIAGRLFAALSLAALCAAPLAGYAADKQRDERGCYRCGTIEAITQRIVPAGVNGYFVYDIHVRMEKTGLLHVVPAPQRGTLDVGDRVSVMGGVVQPVN
jgi:hypothetical protein